MSRPTGRVLAAGVVLIGLVWVLAPSARTPLYDGIGGTSEPYRYLSPPPGATRTQPPGSTTQALPVSGGHTSAAFLNTDEQPPQVQLLLGDGALVAPAGATSVTVSIKPVPPPTPLPATLGRLDGNVYAVTATADKGGAVTVNPAVTMPTVVLRGPPGSTRATIARLDAGGTWTALRTVPLGNGVPDMVAAATGALGDFTLVLPAGQPTGSGGGGGGGGGGSGGGFPWLAVVLPVLGVLIVTATVVAVRLSRTSR